MILPEDFDRAIPDALRGVLIVLSAPLPDEDAGLVPAVLTARTSTP